MILDIYTYVITTIMLQTSDYLDWLANGVNHSHPDFGGPGCYTFRSSAQWVRMSTSTCIRMKYVHMQCYVPVFFLGWRDHCSTCFDPPPRRLGSQQAFRNSSTNCRAHKSFRVAAGWIGIIFHHSRYLFTFFYINHHFCYKDKIKSFRWRQAGLVYTTFLFRALLLIHFLFHLQLLISLPPTLSFPHSFSSFSFKLNHDIKQVPVFVNPVG